MQQTTVVLDKNVIERLAEEPQPERDRLLNRLIGKFQLVIPYVLIEETLGNYRTGGTRTAAAEKLMPILHALRPAQREEELEQILHELVIEKATPLKLRGLPNDFWNAILAIDSGGHQFQAVLQERFQGRKRRAKLLRQCQMTLFGGRFRFMNSEKEFLTEVVEPAMKASDPIIQQVIVDFLTDVGAELAQRTKHVGSKDVIRDAFLAYINTTPPSKAFTRYWITTSFLLSHLVYFLGPQCRISDGTSYGQKIIEHESDNLEDQRYVASALTCGHLITGDGGMAKIMKCFEGSVWWRTGKVFFLDRNHPIGPQIEAITT